MRDVFTDLVANAERFDAPGMPPESSAHRGMVAGVDCLLKRLREGNMLERIFNTYPEYTLVLTGHSLGAGVSILLAAKLRSRFPDLRVYAFATPAGLLSREAARYTESYAFTIGVGDDFVMRLGVDSIENLRTSIIETIRACKLPKVSEPTQLLVIHHPRHLKMLASLLPGALSETPCVLLVFQLTAFCFHSVQIRSFEIFKIFDIQIILKFILYNFNQ